MLKLLSDLQDRVSSGRHKLATAGVVTLMCVLGYHVIFGANGLLDYEQKRRESRALDQQMKSVQQQNTLLEQRIKALKSDPKAIEKEARERLRYARPGEVVYTLPPASSATPANQR